MKRTSLIRVITNQGCVLNRHGKRHDIFINPVTGNQSPITRHEEIKESLVRLIEKQLGILKYCLGG